LEASRAASSILRTNPDPEVRSALSSLHNNLVAIEISEQQGNTDHHNKGIQRKVSLLPANVVIAVVKKAKGCPGDSRPQQALTVTSDTTIICSLK
jgi:phosphoribosylamine-glycine ligase